MIRSYSLLCVPRLLFRISPRCCARLYSTKPSTPPVPPPSPSANHNDLTSFLAYAARTSLAPESTTYVGTRYEYTVLESLRRYAIDLHRIGGRLDSGIDLVGTWKLPASPEALRVIVQCKALRNKIGPNLVRELEGTFPGAPVGWRGEGILGILVSTREATRGVRDTLAKSRYPLMWILAEQNGELRQVLWNRKAAEIGLEGLGVEIRYGGESEPTKQTIAFTWEGEEIKRPEELEES